MAQPTWMLEDESKRKEEWDEVENLVLDFQKQFNQECTEEEIEYSQLCGNLLIDRFAPLFKKYLTLLKYTHIDFTDKEMKEFIVLFMDDYELKKALYRKKINHIHRAEVYQKFNFVIETYGKVAEEDMISDLNMCFLTLAKRYKAIGKNFCAYVYNTYRHEVARHIKKFINNPLSIQYKNYQYEDCINGEKDVHIDIAYEDNYYESATGLPDLTWIAGQSCSDVFNKLTPFQRKVLIKYYLEDWNDRQIAENMGAHINTVNQKRRDAIELLCSEFNINKDNIKRSRKSGKKASLPTLN